MYPGSVPLDTHILQPQRNTEIALGRIMQAVFGTSTVVDGLKVTQQSSPNMTVQVGPGAIITNTSVDSAGVAYGSLALDVSALVKVGINQLAVNMSALVAPAVAGQSQNWLIEAQFLEVDGTPVVLPYYNSATPSLPFTGPSNTGTSQNTVRLNTVQLQWKGGTAATTGSQNTPTPDANWSGIAVVTVANGQATITNANIVPYIATPTVPTKLPYLRQRLTADLTLYVAPTGSDSNTGLASWNPFATLQKAWNYIIQSLDLNGFVVTVSVANGTYTAGVTALGSPVGNSQGAAGIVFLGNAGSPSSCFINVSNGICFLVAGSQLSISGFKLSATGSSGAGTGYALYSENLGFVNITGACEFGVCGASHMQCTTSSVIGIPASYSISGGAVYHWSCSTSSNIFVNSITTTLTGTPAFSGAFAIASASGVIFISSSTYTGTATGKKFITDTAGGINTNLAGTSYLPGSVAGVTTSPGWYS